MLKPSTNCERAEFDAGEANLFEEVVGLDPDAEMLSEAARLAAAQGTANARWVCMRAEELPARLGRFRVASFGQSFHWMDRERVAAAVFTMLEPGDALVAAMDRRKGWHRLYTDKYAVIHVAAAAAPTSRLSALSP